MAARALSMADLSHTTELPESVERLEQSQLEEEIAKVDCMMEDMELKVNVLRWMVESRGPQYADPVSTDSASLALLSLDEEDPGPRRPSCERSRIFMALLVCGLFVVAAALSVSVVYFT